MAPLAALAGEATALVGLALSTGEAIFLIALVAIPVAALSFLLGASGALRSIGRPAPVERPVDPGLREEVRGLVLARDERRRRRGEPPLDVEAEVEAELRRLDGLGG